jgi:ankyrin repeat protein
MSDFERLIESAKRGDVAELRAIVQGHAQNHAEHVNQLVNQKDPLGATALHHAAFGGHREVIQILVEHGANINAADSEFGATPAGWAIEYLREMGGFLGIELNDFAYAIGRGDLDWVARSLKRFPALRDASDSQGRPFKRLAEQSGHSEIVKLFRSGAGA